MERVSDKSDVIELKRIWKDVFRDSDAFVDFFFSERFLPDFSSVSEINGKIVCCIHSYPFEFKIRNSVVPGIMVCGVSTDSGYRNKGYMRKLMSFHLNRLAEEGYVIACLKAVNPSVYESSGFADISNNKTVIFNGAENIIENFDIKKNISILWDIYLRFAEEYSLIINRSYNDFNLKMNEYILTGAKCLVHYSGTKIDAYCIYFEEDNKVIGEECVALTNAAYEDILKILCISKGTAKIPENVALDSYYDYRIEYGNSAACLDVKKLLKICGLNGQALKIKDEMISANNSVFSLNGTVISNLPDITLSSASLLQWISGYKSIKELYDESFIECNEDQSIIEYMDSIGKYSTYIIDEY